MNLKKVIGKLPDGVRCQAFTMMIHGCCDVLNAIARQEHIESWQRLYDYVMSMSYTDMANYKIEKGELKNETDIENCIEQKRN